MGTACVALLLLFLCSTSSGYEEKDFQCPHMGVSVPTTSVCNGLLDCTLPSHVSSTDDLSDESAEICAPTPFLDNEIVFQIRDITSTSGQLSWSKATTRFSNHSLKLAGYFLTGKSEPHIFHNTISGRLRSYHAQSLKPWTQYTFILRPYYTESGKPQTSYKIGRAASVSARTLSADPEAPSLVSVLSAQQRNVVLNIVGPPTWNSDPVGFHVQWDAMTDHRGPRGGLSVPLPADWSLMENTLNVTLPLPGGHDYRLLVSARGTDSANGNRTGPALDVDVSVPLDSYEISAYAIDSSRAVISWRASGVVEVFKMTLYIDLGEELLPVNTSRQFEGTDKASSRRTVLVTSLRPWMHYIASLEGCSGYTCSIAVNASFTTPPQHVPRPVITRAESTSNSSFELAWTFPKDDIRLYDGFSVQYCSSSTASCIKTETKEKKLTVKGLNPDTTFTIEVRAQFRKTDGSLLLGSPASESVTTWKDVPDFRITYEANIQDDDRTHLLSWECVRSDLDYIQYMTAETENWTTCSDSADCDVTVNNVRTTMLSSGYLRLTIQQVPLIHNQVWFRGCNDHGCGQEHSLSLYSQVSGPPSLTDVSIALRVHDAILRWYVQNPTPYQGVEVTWHCNDDKSTVYVIRASPNYWHGTNQETPIVGIPANAEHCKFAVSTYKNQDEETYYGPPVEATLQ